MDLRIGISTSILNFFVFIFFVSIDLSAQRIPNINADSLKLKIFKQVTKNKNSSGNFRQEQYIKEMDTTLESSGTYTFSSGNKIFWIQVKPFAMIIEIGDTSIQTKANGSIKTMTASSDPQVFVFAKTFFSLFNGDIGSLEEKFNVKATGNLVEWQVLLLPKDDISKKFIKSITLSGSEGLEKLKIQDTNSNKMSIYLLQENK